MLYSLFMHLAHLAAVGVMSYDQAGGVAIDVVSVVIDSEESLTGSKEKDALILGNWVGHESAGRAHVVGDQGASIGAMQIGKLWFSMCKTNEIELKADRRKNIECGYKIMLANKITCGGSIRAALRSYASGKCSGTNSARALVELRCNETGAC